MNGTASELSGEPGSARASTEEGAGKKTKQAGQPDAGGKKAKIEKKDKKGKCDLPLFVSLTVILIQLFVFTNINSSIRDNSLVLH